MSLGKEEITALKIKAEEKFGKKNEPKIDSNTELKTKV